MLRTAVCTTLLLGAIFMLAALQVPRPRATPAQSLLQTGLFTEAPATAASANEPPAKPVPVTLRVGFAQCDISPDKSANLMGYNFRAPGNDGVSQPLFAKVCVLREGDTRAVLVSFDLCVIPTDIARKLREKIARAAKCEAAAVIVAATHTHSGPYPFADYFAGIEANVLDAVQRASGLTVPFDVRVREAPLGIGYNRRVWDGKKVLMCWNPQEYPDRNPDVAPDPTCTVLQLRQQNGPRQVVLWSLGVHPVTLGKTSRVVSADYPGAACRLIEADLADAHAMFFLGAAGNVQPWIATQNDADRVQVVGKAAGAFVSLLTHAVHPVVRDADKPLRFAAETVKIGKVEVDLAVWRLGNLWIVAAPVELFGELGVELRKRLGGPVFLATLANGWHGYWPTRAAFEQGGYEVGATPGGLQAGDSEKLIDELVRLGEKLR